MDPIQNSGTWREACGEAHKGCVQVLETACRELPGFEYFQNLGSLVGAKPCLARNSAEIWPRFFCLGGESASLSAGGAETMPGR